MTSRKSNARFPYVVFGSDVCRHISQIMPFNLKLYFGVGVFLQVPPIFRKNLFLEHLCKMVSISSIEKDSIATARDSFKDCIFTCNISNKMHTNVEKRKVSQAARVILLKNCCSVRHMFCTIFVHLKFFEKHVRSSS